MTTTRENHALGDHRAITVTVVALGVFSVLPRH
jgi:hypothetical protein